MEAKSRFCIKCIDEIKPIHPEHHGDKPEQDMWSGGIVGRISAGYGSTLDGDIFIVAICDKCLKNEDSGQPEYVGRYM